MRSFSARALLVVAGALTCVCADTSFCSAQSTPIDKSAALRSARERYYNLRTAGLSDVHGTIHADWNTLLAGTSVQPGTKALLNALLTSFKIDDKGSLYLDHGGDRSLNQISSDEVKKIFKGMDDAVSSFFGTWSIFLLTSPFPAIGSDYQLGKLANGYQFTQRQGELNVSVDTDNEFAIMEIRVSGLELTASLKPILEKTPSGFLLKGYAASSQRRATGRITTVQAALEYETIEGLRLLHKVSLDTVFEGAPAKLEWLFRDYQVKLR